MAGDLYGLSAADRDVLLRMIARERANYSANVRSLAPVPRDKPRPANRDLKWFVLYADLSENDKAEAYLTKWDKDNDKWIKNEDVDRVEIHSTATGVTGLTDQFMPCWFNWKLLRWEVISAPAATGIPFRNDSSGSETVPAYGVMRVTGSTTISGVEHVTVAKPNTDFKRKYLVNGPTAVPYNETGKGTWLEEADWVLYDDSNTPTLGESWGPSDGSWKLKKWRYGFTIVGNPSGGTTDIVRAWQEEINEFIGKTDSTHNKNSTGTVSIYDGNLADTTDNMASVENKFANVGSGKWVQVRWNAGKWHLVAAEC